MSSASSTVGGKGRRTRADREVRVPQLRRHRSAREPRVAQALGDELGQAPHLVVQSLAIGEVACERVLGGYGDRLELEVEIARVDPTRAIAEHRADRPGQERAQLGIPERCERPDRLDAGPAQSFFGARADARKETDGERSEEARLGSRRDDGDATGLAAIGRDLADHLRRADAERARQARLRAHRGLNRRRDCTCAREVGCDRAEIEVALVDSRALHARHDLADRVPHDARVLAIERVSRPQEDGGRAAPQRLGCAHRRVDAELPRGVVRGRDDAAAVRVSSDDERLVAELRVLELLDGREERVEVEVREDLHGSKATVAS